MNQSLLRQFYLDKHLKKEVYDFILDQAKNLVIEQAAKGENVIWFEPLLTVLSDTERELNGMFEQVKEEPKINHAK